MKYTKISDKVKDIIDTSKGEVQLSEGFSFNHHETIRRITLYANDRYLTPENNDDIFWNISSSRSVHFAKNIDLDTKDLLPYGIGETNFLQAWVLRIKLRKWLEESDLSDKLDNLSSGVSDFGSWVWKIVPTDDKLQDCDLKNLYFDPTLKTIRGKDKVELHFLTKQDIENKEWENIDQLIKDEPKDGKYEIWEFTGYWDKKFRKIIGKNYGSDEIIAYEEELDEDEDPYYDFHIGRYKGTWLRMGVYQRLFKLQERVNQLVNQNAKTTEIASMLLLQSENPEARGNIFTSMETGDVLSDPTLRQVLLQNPGLSTFFNEMAMIEKQADRLCLTPEVMVGDSLPSGTPFRSLAVLSNAAKSAFKSTRDRLGDVLEEILLEHVLPDEVKTWNRGDMLEIAEDESDVRIYDEAIKNQMAIETMLSGRLVTEDVSSLLDTTINEQIGKVGRKVEVPKGFFNFKFGIRFNITGESFDKQQQNDAMFNAIQMVAANPGLINIPLFKQYLENNGISYWKLTPQQVEQIVQGQQAGQPMAQPKQDALMSQVDTNP